MNISDIPLIKGIRQIERAIESGQSPLMFHAGDIDRSLHNLIESFGYVIFETWLPTIKGKHYEQKPYKLLILK